MLFAVHCEDKSDSLSVRQAARPEHLTYVKGFKVVMAGPTLDDSGEVMTGSLLIIDVPDREAADAFAAGDPYAKAGLFARTTVQRFKQTVP